MPYVPSQISDLAGLRARFGVSRQPVGVGSQYYQFVTGTTAHLSRLWLPTPNGLNGLVLRYGNWGVNVGSPNGEVAVSPAFSVWSGVIERASGATGASSTVVPCTFGGRSEGTVLPGCNLDTDPLGIVVPPGAGNGVWVVTRTAGYLSTDSIPRNWITSSALSEGARNKVSVTDPSAAPTLATATTGGRIQPGTYTIAFAYYDSIGAATALSPPASVTVPTGTNTNTITVTTAALPTNAQGVYAYLLSGGLWVGFVGNATGTAGSAGTVTLTSLAPAALPAPTPGNVSVAAGNTAYGPAQAFGFGGDQLLPQILIVGDSIEQGDASQDASSSWIQYALGGQYQFTRCAITGDQAQYFLASRRMRNLMAQGCTHGIWCFGNNDWTTGGRTSSQMLADAVTGGYWMARQGIKPYVMSLPPRTTSTDGWVTETNQTTVANDAQRLAYNAGLSALVGNGKASAPFYGVIDAAAAVAGANTSKWKNVGGVALTSDGTHPVAGIGRQTMAAALPTPSALFAVAA